MLPGGGGVGLSLLPLNKCLICIRQRICHILCCCSYQGIDGFKVLYLSGRVKAFVAGSSALTPLKIESLRAFFGGKRCRNS